MKYFVFVAALSFLGLVSSAREWTSSGIDTSSNQRFLIGSNLGMSCSYQNSYRFGAVDPGALCFW